MGLMTSRRAGSACLWASTMVRSSVGWLVVLLVCLMGALNCGDGESEFQEKVEQTAQRIESAAISIDFPDSLELSEVALLGSNSVTLADNTSMATVPNGGAIVATGSVQTELGAGSVVGSVTSIPSVFLRSNALVSGDLQTGGTITEQTGVQIQGTLETNASIALQNFKGDVDVPTDVVGSASLEPDQTLAIHPGAYTGGSIKSRATLTLDAGVYKIDNLSVEPQAELVVPAEAASVVIVTNSLTFQGSLSTTSGAASGDEVLFVVLGPNQVPIEKSLSAAIYAPAASVSLGLGSGITYKGTVFAKDVLLNPGTAFEHVVFPWVLPPDDLAPTLNCVVQVGPSTFGALFGYTNESGAPIKLAAGPRNSISPGIAPGEADRGQPILFMPGEVPIATFQYFPAGEQVTWSIGNESVVATASSPACPAALGDALTRLYAENTAAGELMNRTIDLLSDPRMAELSNRLREVAGAAITPFESELLNAYDLVIANVHLLRDPATLTPEQLQQRAAFRREITANPALVALRLEGDALRATPAALQCNSIAAVNAFQPGSLVVPARSGSLQSEFVDFGQSAALSTVRSELGALAVGGEGALRTTTGATLAATLPGEALAELLENLQLPGPIPVGFWDTVKDIGTVVAGAVVMGYAGAQAGSAFGPWGVVAGGVIGAVVGGYLAYKGIVQCQPCDGTDDSDPCVACTDGCCEDPDVSKTWEFLHAGTCPDGKMACSSDGDCLAAGTCVANCCEPIDLDFCPDTPKCTVDSDCSGDEEICQWGCCAGRCGLGGTICDQVDTLTCSERRTCGANETCEQGCCVLDDIIIE